MNIMNRVTSRELKLNRVRTAVTVIGIILSTAMFTAVITICTSLYNYMREAEVYQSGSYHVYAMHVSGEAVAEAASDTRAEYVAAAKDLGYAEIDSANEYKPYIFVLAADSEFFEAMPVHLTKGRLPQNGSELLIPEHLLTNGGVAYNIGDTVRLDIGQRVAAELEEEDGFVLYQEHSFGVYSEELTNVRMAEYTVVGTYRRPDFEPFSAPGYTVLTLDDNEQASGAQAYEGVYECWLRFVSPKKNLTPFMNEHPALTEFGWQEHSGLLMLEGVTRYGNITNVLTAFAVILSVLIFIGSVSLIYSAFSISVSERTRQFGLLSSIGATKKQMRRSVLYEALSLSAIGIPTGVAAGLGGIAVTLRLLRDKFSSFMSAGGLPIRVSVTWTVILAGALIALVTVLVSAWIPSGRAMRISPMEAIRQSRDVKAKKGGVRYPKSAARLFGAEGLLAKKYFTRSRSKYRATIISLAMSIVLFVAASGFCMYITRSVDSVDNRPSFDGMFAHLEYDDFVRLRPALAESCRELVGYIDTEEESPFAYFPREDASQEYSDFIAKKYEAYGEVRYEQHARRVFMDDVSFRLLLAQNGIADEGWFDSSEPKALMVNSASVPVYESLPDGSHTRVNYVISFLKPGVASIRLSPVPECPEGYGSNGVYWTGEGYGEGELAAYCISDASIGTDLDFDEKGRPIGQLTIPLEFYSAEIGAFIDDYPIGGDNGGTILLIYPASVYTGSASKASFYFRSDNVQQSMDAMQKVLEANGVAVNDRSFYDATEDARLMNNLVTIVKVFSYGFIALISLISVANVFNTVTTNVALRRRDYAMLRSMGMTGRGINRMGNYECLIYGTRSLMIGLPVAVGVTYLIHRAANGAANMRFTLPWTAMAIAVVSVFVVVFISMLYSTRKLKADDPVETLKDENI